MSTTTPDPTTLLSESDIAAIEAEAQMIARSGYQVSGPEAEVVDWGAIVYPQHSAHSVALLAANLREAKAIIAANSGVSKTLDEHLKENAARGQDLADARLQVRALEALRDTLVNQRDTATGKILSLRMALSFFVPSLPNVDPNDPDTKPDDIHEVGPYELSSQTIWRIRTAYQNDVFAQHARNLADDQANSNLTASAPHPGTQVVVENVAKQVAAKTAPAGGSTNVSDR